MLIFCHQETLFRHFPSLTWTLLRCASEMRAPMKELSSLGSPTLNFFAPSTNFLTKSSKIDSSTKIREVQRQISPCNIREHFTHSRICCHIWHRSINFVVLFNVQGFNIKNFDIVSHCRLIVMFREAILTVTKHGRRERKAETWLRKAALSKVGMALSSLASLKTMAAFFPPSSRLRRFIIGAGTNRFLSINTIWTWNSFDEWY